ncbi:hypothetical protein BT96DRAFT_929186 [Gymnopus androsaceus JB14]|uniref:Uncharacterized protein n=1 Tax=Gymnopus androsaceus JB14 TaxID=1447944 RepID=A0A6A4GGW1_9AGAR|nr:hypothetical protein BT96DRAFT_929186 [Gymnopus androsaceus JB14]
MARRVGVFQLLFLIQVEQVFKPYQGLNGDAIDYSNSPDTFIHTVLPKQLSCILDVFKVLPTVQLVTESRKG